MRSLAAVLLGVLLGGCSPPSASPSRDGSTSESSLDVDAIDAANEDDAAVVDSAPSNGDGAQRDASTEQDASVAPMDAAGDGATEINVPLDLVGQRFVRALAILRAGGAVDLDDDGVAETASTVNADGSSTLVVRSGARALLRIEHRADGSVHAVGDRDLDGRVDYDRAVEASGAHRSVVTEDTDRDGVVDRRVSVTHEIGVRLGDKTVSVEATGESDPPVWQPVSQYTSSGANLQCAVERESSGSSGGTPAGCRPQFNAIPGFDAFRTAAVELVPHIYVVRSGPYACSADQHASLARTLGRILSDLPRLQRINRTLHTSLVDAMRTEELMISCEVPVCLIPIGVEALTVGPEESFFGDAFPHHWWMAFRGTNVTLPTDSFEELFVHELLHFAGRTHPGSSDGEGQRDEVYSCARHTNQCRAYAPVSGRRFYLGDPADASSARDAAVCAELEHKGEFYPAARPHVQQIRRSTRCNVEVLGMRRDALLCGPNLTDPPTAAATCCRRNEPVWCDLSTIPARARAAADSIGPRCVERCPSGLVTGADCESTGGINILPKYSRVCGFNIEACQY